MTVAQLIKVLGKMNQNAIIVVCNGEGMYRPASVDMRQEPIYDDQFQRWNAVVLDGVEWKDAALP